MLLLYDHNESVCCQKVRTALAEKQIAYHNRYVALEKGEQLSEAFLAVNPKGVVPVLDHDGRIITESSIILEYIDEAFDGPALMPADPYWRAVRRQWAKRIDDGMHVPHIAAISFIIAFSRAFRKNFDTEEKLQAYLDRVPSARARENLRESFHAAVDSERLRTSIRAYDLFLADMERALADSPWLAGTAFSLADIDVAPYVWRLHSLQLSCLWTTRPRVADWFARVTARPSWQAAVVNCALEEWTALMRATGSEAQPVVERMLAEAA